MLQNVATAATNVFASDSPAMTLLGQLVAGLLNALSLPFVAALYAADAVGNVVAHRAEYQADRRVVRMGYGRNLSQALRRVISLGGGQRPVGGVPVSPRRTRRARPGRPNRRHAAPPSGLILSEMSATAASRRRSMSSG